MSKLFSSVEGLTIEKYIIAQTPSCTALFEDTLYIYYGAADEQIAYASVSISALMKELILHPKKEALAT